MGKNSSLIRIGLLSLLSMVIGWVLYDNFGWELSIAFLFLVALLYALTQFLSFRTTKVVDHSTSIRSAEEIEKIVKAIKTKADSVKISQPEKGSDQTEKVSREEFYTPDETEKGEKLSGFNPSVFTDFKKSLQQQESSQTDTVTETQKEGLIVNLSSSAKSKSRRRVSQIMEADGTRPQEGAVNQLFEDVAEPLDERSKSDFRKVPDQQKTASPAPAAHVEEADLIELEEVQMEPTPQRENIPPPMARETLTSKDFEISEEEVEKEDGVLLFAAQKADESRNYEDGLKLLSSWYKQIDSRAVREHDPELIFLKGKFELKREQWDNAVTTWKKLFDGYLKQGESSFVTTLEEITDQFIETSKQEFAVPFLITLLNEYRKKNNRPLMDKIYCEIEKGYKAQQDWQQLIKTYQNHLQIRKVMDDIPGQFELLDLLGKLMYDQGDELGSKVCYEQSVELSMKATT